MTQSTRIPIRTQSTTFASEIMNSLKEIRIINETGVNINNNITRTLNLTVTARVLTAG